MNLAGSWFIQPEEPGVKELKAFIDASLHGAAADKSELLTNETFSFTLYKEDRGALRFERRNVERAADRRKVVVPAKTKLRFYPAPGETGVRDRSRVIFNEGTGRLTLHFKSGDVTQGSTPLEELKVKSLAGTNFGQKSFSLK